MSDVIQFANAAQQISAMTEINQQVSGLTMGEAVSRLSPEVASNGMRLVGTTSQVGGGTIEFPSGVGAEQAFETFQETGGVVSTGNAALTGAGSIGAGTVALASSQSVPVGVVGVASGSVGVAAAACAPAFGVALGIGLYAAAPDFWTEVSQALLPWVWEGLDIMPVVYDENGNTYLPQEAIEALRDVYESAMSSDYILNNYVPQNANWALVNEYTFPVTFVPLPYLYQNERLQFDTGTVIHVQPGYESNKEDSNG